MQPLMQHAYKRRRWSVWQWEDIEDGERPEYVYLRRLIFFKTPFVALYRHYIYVRDSDRDPHNHPRPFLSFVLRGGYTEERFRRWDRRRAHGTQRFRTRWSFARTRMRDFHSVTKLDDSPTITLLLLGPVSKGGWGFLTPDGYVDSEPYLKEKRRRWAANAVS